MRGANIHAGGMAGDEGFGCGQLRPVGMPAFVAVCEQPEIVGTRFLRLMQGLRRNGSAIEAVKAVGIDRKRLFIFSERVLPPVHLAQHVSQHFALV